VITELLIIAECDRSMLRENFSLYRYMFGLAAVPSVVQFAGFIFMPETPRYLVTKGHIDKARMVLHHIYGPGVDVEQEITEISNSIQQNAEYRKLFVSTDY